MRDVSGCSSLSYQDPSTRITHLCQEDCRGQSSFCRHHCSEYLECMKDLLLKTVQVTTTSVLEVASLTKHSNKETFAQLVPTAVAAVVVGVLIILIAAVAFGLIHMHKRHKKRQPSESVQQQIMTTRHNANGTDTEASQLISQDDPKPQMRLEQETKCAGVAKHNVFSQQENGHAHMQPICAEDGLKETTTTHMPNNPRNMPPNDKIPDIPLREASDSIGVNNARTSKTNPGFTTARKPGNLCSNLPSQSAYYEY